jgi:alanyl-tRNA synthetase
MNTAELRAAYLEFFEARGHRVMPSGPLVPHNDPTLLFTNSGMVQFKDPLLGKEDPGYKRATSAQRCVRAGGKHNDLENVGYTARHHTFFEMMGNFSFGDYFKEETIAWAWEFIIEVLKLPVDKLWVTVHPTDDESRKLWRDKIGVRPERIIDIEENFWTMGDTGPCGPNTEIFYDHGPDVFGGPPGSPDEDGDRFIEFWNLVFPQFDLSADGELAPLPQFGVDTGLGLERTAAIMQGVHSNYEIDLFRRLMLAAGAFAGINDEQEILNTPSLRVIADHIRSSAFLIADGVVPGSETRAYVLRRIIRRGLRHGYKLDIKEPFFHKLVDVLVEEMGEAHPIIAERQAEVTATLAREEERFSETLNQGMELLQEELSRVRDGVLPGDIAFKLYDTYGFPVDLTADVIREKGHEVDMAGFDAAMEEQRERGRAATSFSASLGQKVTVQDAVEFVGYGGVAGEGNVVALFDGEGEPVEGLDEGQAGIIVLDRTPFYAESGGQVGDTGLLSGGGAEFAVDDTQVSGRQHIHVGAVRSGSVALGTSMSGSVNERRRSSIRRNHSATHLLHAALRRVLGTHVQQKGSLVNDEKLRFDFSHSQPVSSDEQREIEDLVNAEVRANTPVETELLSYDQAIEKGAMALFGEKYGDEVRVLTMGRGYSVELCGGTHVSRTGDIGLVKIVAETGIAAGVRRIEAVSGDAAIAEVRNNEGILDRVTELLKTNRSDLVDRLSQLLNDNRGLSREVETLNQKLAASRSSDLGSEVEEVSGVPFLAAKVDGDGKTMMRTLDTLRSQHPEGVLVLAQESKGRVAMVVGVGKASADRVSAADLLAEIGPLVGVKGGGNESLARGGGGSVDQLDRAFDRAREWLVERLG